MTRNHKRLIVTVDLTDEQRAALEPLFALVRDTNNAGLHERAIIAQVWPDGIRATTVTPKEVAAIRRAMGNTSAAYSGSAWDEEVAA